jgi:hypothetical protein
MANEIYSAALVLNAREMYRLSQDELKLIASAVGVYRIELEEERECLMEGLSERGLGEQLGELIKRQYEEVLEQKALKLTVEALMQKAWDARKKAEK